MLQNIQGARSSSSRSKVQRDEARRRLNDLQQLQKADQRRAELSSGLKLTWRFTWCQLKNLQRRSANNAVNASTPRSGA